MVVVVERSKVKITVLRCLSPSDVFGANLPAKLTRPVEVCRRLTDGQEFIVEEDSEMPKGFCNHAWISIYGNVRTLAFGGNFPWFNEAGVAINCCTDGLRPVIFKLNRI